MSSIAHEADALIARVRSRGATASEVKNALVLLNQLRKIRDFGRLSDLAEELARAAPDEPNVRAYYAQSLIDSGHAMAALDVLEAAIARVADTAARLELFGLLGRANKQIFMDAADRSTAASRMALTRAIEAYGTPFGEDPRRYWHGINLAAMLHAARRAGVTPPGDLDRDLVARRVLSALVDVPQAERDTWWNAAKGEAHIALGEWREAEGAIHDYVHDPNISAFALAGTVRQLREIWEAQRQPEGAGLLQLLEARLAQVQEVLELRPAYVREMRQNDEPTWDQRERVLGDVDAQPMRWYRTALERAASVAAVRLIGGKRFGTAFAVRARDLGLPNDDVLVLTNFHVLNRNGLSAAEKPASTEIVFEAAGETGFGPYSVAEIVAESPFDGGLDYTLMRMPEGSRMPPPLPVSRDLPKLDLQTKPRVSVIGHPLANELHLALQDNLLLDHEGPPEGKPKNAHCCLVHYFTPTSKGNSGSPVFDAAWNVIALHHLGGRYAPLESEFGIPRLNGKAGNYSANEGIWIGSICDDVARRLR